ncbi:hypothetical protein GCM10009554_21090 [Kribbella koreensis]|uniref:Intracellular septation protein A n=1 Tax=Kribbella koreensis TaxID=57909 RepID=A0ABN1PXY7_9ACTN
MSYLRTFAPWIVYALIPSAHWNWAALIALVLSVGLIAQQTRAGRTADALIIEIGSAVFFAVITVVAFTSPDSGLHPYAAALSSGTLALIAGISLAIRKPFTLGVAKQTTPREYWGQPLFVRVNVIITAVWTGCFAVTGLCLLALAHSGSAGRTVVQVAGFVVPMVFTLRYVAHIQAKAAQLRAS